MSVSNSLLSHTGAPSASNVNFDVDVTGQNNAFWVPEIFSKNVLIAFRKASVVEAICNTDYFGEIAQYGDTVNIIKEPQITLHDYRRGGQVDETSPTTGDWSTTDLTDEELTLTIDQAKAFQFGVEDLDTRFSHINWQALASDNAAYQMKDAMDVNVLSNIISNVDSGNVLGADAAVESGSSVDPAAASINMGHDSGEVDPLDVVARMARMLDDDKIPEENRWLVAAPEFYEELAKTASKLMSVDYNQGDGGLRNGLVAAGKIRGFSLYKSNNIYSAASPTYASGVVLAGHMSAVACASDLTKVENFRSQTQFKDVVRGLMVWGRKVLRPTGLSLAYYTID